MVHSFPKRPGLGVAWRPNAINKQPNTVTYGALLIEVVNIQQNS